MYDLLLVIDPADQMGRQLIRAAKRDGGSLFPDPSTLQRGVRPCCPAQGNGGERYGGWSSRRPWTETSSRTHWRGSRSGPAIQTRRLGSRPPRRPTGDCYTTP